MVSNDTNSASTTLTNIIDELKLKYDSSVGLLDGEVLQNMPNANVLLNLNKLLSNLIKELDENESTDNTVLARIDSVLQPKDSTSTQQPSDQEEEEKEEEKEAEDDSGRKKRTSAAEDDRDELESSKRRKTDADGVKTEDAEAGLKNKDEGAPSEEKPEEKDVPPIQTGSYTQDNDTRLKNPKSEFVPSQTLPAESIAKLGLFSEDNNGLETQGKEYLKKKYGVASYPENDLQDALPGPIPNVDFSKNKPPSNQVQFTTFQSYLESYFRPFLNEDINFLNENYVLAPGMDKSNYDPNVSPYIIPKLGPFYADVWSEEDANLGSKINVSGYQQPSVESYKPKGSVDEILDENLYTEEVSCGPLSSRLLSAVLNAHEGRSSDDEDNGDDSTLFGEDVATRLDTGEDYKFMTEVNDFHSIEERLKRELKYIGIFMNLPSEDESQNKLILNGRYIKRNNQTIIDTDDWVRNKEDDEVCAEIRSLQKTLREVTARNKRNKKKLIPIVEEHLAWQEYYTILEELNKQVDQAYTKRLKVKNKKKKVELSPAQQQAANSGLRTLLDKRKRWIENIGKLFKPPEVMKRLPKESILQDDSAEDENEEEVNDDAEESIKMNTV